MNAYSNFGNEYKKNSIETASPLRLVVMLYEGAIKFLDEAEENMHYTTYDKVNTCIARAKDIVVELQTSLNFKEGGEISERLSSLYLYVLEKLREANIEKSKEPLQEARSILKSLLGSWQEMEKGNSGDSVASKDSGGFSPEDLEDDSGFSFSVEG